MKRPYEVITVLRILSNEDETQAAINQIVAYLEGGSGEAAMGKITRIDRTSLGRRKLAYEIDKQRDGLYVIFHVDIEPRHIRELELNLRLYNPVLRHLVVRPEEIVAKKKSTKEPKPAEAETETPATPDSGN